MCVIRGTSGLRPALRDSQEEVPVCLCRGCGGELYPGETSFFWDNCWVCVECFQRKAAAWMEEASVEAAQVLGVEMRCL